MRDAVCILLCALFALSSGAQTFSSASLSDSELVALAVESRNAALEAANSNPNDPWDVFRAAVDNSLWPNVVVTVGNQSGTVFRHIKGDYTMDTEIGTASAAKWPSAVTIVRMLPDFGLTLDTRIYDVLRYWTRDESDPRSRVTIRHALAFVTGFSGGPGCTAAMNTQQCAEHYYYNSPHVHEPGSYKEYFAGHIHLTIAAAVVEMVSGRRFIDLFQAYVGAPSGMRNTRYTNTNNPGLAGGMTSTSADYSNFLQAYFDGRLVSPRDRDEMERDQFPNANRDLFSLITGRYSLGNWYECVVQGILDNGLSEICRDREEHGSAGIWGWWPGHDAKLNFWWQWMVQDNVVTSGVYRIAWKPIINAVITGQDIRKEGVLPPPPTLADIANLRKMEILARGEAVNFDDVSTQPVSEPVSDVTETEGATRSFELPPNGDDEQELL